MRYGRTNYMIMNTTEFRSSEQYAAPDIVVVEIELNQNILQASAELPDIGDGGDAW